MSLLAVLVGFVIVRILTVAESRRLTEGAPLEVKGPELISFGLAFGIVQVPASGQPILLMADHQTAGGYPAVAGVTRAALPLAAQLLPGNRLRLDDVSVTAAQAAHRNLRAALERIA